MMKDRVFAQAALLAGELEENQEALLRLLCDSTVSSLEKKLKEGLTPGDCEEDFAAAASFLALAALQSVGTGVREFKAGDLTVVKDREATASRCLRRQGEAIIEPYLRDSFAFLGV